MRCLLSYIIWLDSIKLTEQSPYLLLLQEKYKEDRMQRVSFATRYLVVVQAVNKPFFRAEPSL